MTASIRITHIEKILEYIHCHLDKPISVKNLAEQSCWSRWQLQRVFQEATGLTLAHYIRELRLSRAAEHLLATRDKHMDIALACGFESEVSFSRAFKQMFECSPREYRQRGMRQGLRTPLQYRSTETSPWMPEKAFMQIRIESREPFSIKGISSWVFGPFSSKPNFHVSIPKIWQQLEKEYRLHGLSPNTENNAIGVIDTHDHDAHPDQFKYWAGHQYQLMAPLPFQASLHIPIQEYAVIPIQGSAQAIKEAIEWFMFYWLPSSQYDGVSGYELEIYEKNYDPFHQNSYMEYWLPIRPR